jgi:peptidoglycan/xylan/chitin deacetylase (PgdA/CDA1 family)
MRPSRRSGLVNLLLVVVGLAFAWGLGEGVAWIFFGRGVDGASSLPDGDAGLYAVEESALYGYELAASREHLAVKPRADGRACYSAVYRTDRFRRRVVGTPDRSRRPHLLLFGCSVAFGEGLGDEDTLQHQLAEALPDVQVHNYGVHGWGPTHALAKLRSGEPAEQVAARRGTAVYVIIPAHVSRAIGDTRTHWLFDAPYYELAPDGTVAGGRPFREVRPWRVAFYEALLGAKRRSWLLSALGVEWPPWHSDDHLRLTAAVLAAARESYRARFDGEFFVAIHPSWELKDAVKRDLHERLLRFLAERGVPVLDYATESQPVSEVIDPGCDWHPNGRLNRRLAVRMADDLQRRVPENTLPPAGALVLVYHRFSADPAAVDGETVSLPAFEEQMRELARRGYRPLSLAELRRSMSEERVATRTVVITLDDGWKSQGLVLPTLRQFGFKAAFGIFPGKGIGWDNFEWPDVEAIAADPLFEIFSHSMTHPWDLRENLVHWIDGKSAIHGPADADFEIFESKRVLEERLGARIDDLAWPRGWYNERLIERAVAAGYEGLLTIDPGTNAPGDDPRRIRRVMVDGRCSIEQFREILDLHRYPSCSDDGPLEHRPSPPP